MSYSHVDCQGFAGGFSVGATLAGWQLKAKLEKPGGFGVPLMDANRAFLGSGWRIQVDDPAKWEPVRADGIFGTPPCSGFSNFSAGTSIGIGINSPINSCMWDFHRYAARCRPAIVIMESVAQAFSNGQVLMRALSDELRAKSGLAYRTTHILQDNYSLGGCTLRRRYFLVNSIVPFGVEQFEHTWLPVVADAISDLADLPVSWDSQPYQSSPTWWSRELRSASGFVDGHDVIAAPNMARLAALQRGDVRWEPGDRESEMLKKYYDAYGELPEEYRYQSHASHTRHLTRDKHLIDRGLETGGFGQTKFWDWSKPGRVITGHGPYQVRHPQNRSYTHRETARIMGFPDDWLCGTESLRALKSMHMFWGKGTSVAPARWVAEWAAKSLDGDPGSETGTELPDGSRLIDVSAAWKDAARRFGLAERLGVPVKPVKVVHLPPPAPVVPALAEVTARVDAEISKVRPQRRPRPAPASPSTSVRRVTAEKVQLTGKCPGWKYERKPTDGPVWDKSVLDRVVTAAQAITGEDARTGTVAALVNDPEFRALHGIEDCRGCASYHVAQTRERLAANSS